MPSKPEHDQDICAWSFHNAQLLRHGRWAELDRANIAEELESIGRSIRRELGRCLRDLLALLLEWHYQPQRRGTDLHLAIRSQRTEIRELLEESPSLQAELHKQLTMQYPEARELAALQADVPLAGFPETCPFCPDQAILNADWPD